MALINCPECGKEISDQAEVCINCGFQLRPSVPVKTKTKPRGRIVAIVIAIILVILISGAATLYFMVIKPNQEYDYAMQVMESGAYEDAVSLFVELDGYKDSGEKIKEAHYKRGMELFANKSYDAALSELQKADDYGDSAVQIQNVQKVIDDLNAELKHQEHIQELKDKLFSVKGLCLADGTYLTSDGLTLVVDGKDENDLMAIWDIYTIVEKLGLPDSLVAEMGSTNALMGKQTESFADFEVSWSYHPDNGLDAYFKIKE